MTGIYTMDIGQLADAYLTDPDSNFSTLRYSTREGYQRNIAKLIKDMAGRELASWSAREAINDYGLDDFEETTHETLAKIDEALRDEQSEKK